MTVKELIERLQSLPQHAEIEVQYPTDGGPEYGKLEDVEQSYTYVTRDVVWLITEDLR